MATSSLVPPLADIDRACDDADAAALKQAALELRAIFAKLTAQQQRKLVFLCSMVGLTALVATSLGLPPSPPPPPTLQPE